MKNKSTLLILFMMGFIPISSMAQEARQILMDAYAYQQNIKSFKALYRITYTSDIDTGKTTSRSINIELKDENLKIFNSEFISISTVESKLFIDHLNKEVSFIPKLYYSDSTDYFIDYLNFYIPKEDDHLILINHDDYYEINISINRNIQFLSYQISKKSNTIQSMTLNGQVHPVLLNDINASLQVELIDFKKGNDIIDTEELMISYYIKKKSDGYSLKQYPTYKLHVLD